MILHGYWRSGAAYRVRIGLNLKGLSYQQKPHDLRTGAQKDAAYVTLNPQGMVPALQIEGDVLIQSPAILEWLEETHPQPALLPADPAARAHVRAMAAIVGCDIHPLNNLRVGKALRGEFGADPSAIDAWAARWMLPGFEALEALVARYGEGWSFGASPTLADCYIVPQLYSAHRFNVSLEPFPSLMAIEAAAKVHPAFVAAHPDRQPDSDATAS